MLLPFKSICKMAMFKRLNYKLLTPRVAGRGICRQNIYDHVAAFSHPIIQLLSFRQHVYQSFLSCFLVLSRLQYCGILGEKIKMLL